MAQRSSDQGRPKRRGRLHAVVLAGAWSCACGSVTVIVGCKNKANVAPSTSTEDPASPDVAELAPELPQVPEIAASAPPAPADDIAPEASPAPVVAPTAAVTSISASELIGMLKSRKELRALTADTGPARFAHLVPAFQEKTREEDLWEVEGVNDAGLVRMVTLSFVPAQQNTQKESWTFRSVAVRLRSEDPRRTFAEIKKAANATFKKVKWLDLSDRDRSAWNMGEHWELVAGVLEEGDIYVRAGRPPRP